MNPDPLKLRHQQQQDLDQVQHQHQSGVAREFASPEELLRHDAALVTPPATVAERLNRSLAGDSVKPQSWWQRWFG